jgi:hypothetical protein
VGQTAIGYEGIITPGSAPALAAIRCSMGSKRSTSGGWLLTPVATITW